MTTTDQDIRALAYLAGRLREDTYGANHWDAAGIMAELKPLVGQNLATSIERVIRHAGDVGAKTPGAIRRPFTPPAQPGRPPLERLEPRERCKTCSKSQPDCRRNPWGDHEFEPDVFRPRDVDLDPVVAELKGHIAPTRTSTEGVRAHE